MNAYEKAMEAIAKVIARGTPQKRQPAKKPAPKRKVAESERRRRISAGVRRRNAPVSLQPVEEIVDCELTHDDEPEVEGPISAPLFVPPVTPPAPVPTSAPLPVTRPHWAAAFERSGPPPASSAPAPAAGPGRGSCKAVDAATGRQCRLPAHPENPDAHRNERGPFFRLLQAGEVPTLRQALDQVATRREGVDYSAAELAPTKGHPKKRDKAHAGEPTTEAHPPERSKYFVPAEASEAAP